MRDDTTRYSEDAIDESIATECLSVSLSRRELYGLFVLTLTVPIFSFASGMYLEKYNPKEAPFVVTSNQKYTVPATLKNATTQDFSTTNGFSDAETNQEKEQPKAVTQQDIDNSEALSINKQSGLPPVSRNLQSQETRQLSSGPLQVPKLPMTINSRNGFDKIQVKQEYKRSFESKKTKAFSTEPRNIHFIVQVGLFKDPNRALNWKGKLDDQFNYSVIPRLYPNKIKRYSVILGFYNTRLDAINAAGHYEKITLNDAYVAQLNEQQIEMTLANL